MSTRDIPAGFYPGRAIAGSEQYGSTSTGNDQIVLELAVPALARNLTTFLVFSDGASSYSLDRLRACGWKGNDLSRLDGIDANEITVAVKYETYKGEEKMKVEIQTGGGRFKLESPMDERQKRAFAARMLPVVKGHGGGAPASAAVARPPVRQTAAPDFDPNAGAQDGDEIPF